MKKYRTYLCHHGIRGMKWGQRNGPPYPLVDSKHSASEKRAGWKKSLDKSSSNDENSKKKFKLSDKQKTAIKIGAAVAVAGLATYGGIKLAKSGKLAKAADAGKNAVKGLLSKEADSSPKPVKEWIENVNPTGSDTNCRAASMSTVLRLKGINAEALDVPGGSLSDAVHTCFKNAKVSEMYNPTKERIDRMILKNGEGSSGVLAATFHAAFADSAHAIAWQVKDGTVKYMDGQKGLEDCSYYFNYLSSNFSAEIARLDNLELADGISKFVKIRK